MRYGGIFKKYRQLCKFSKRSYSRLGGDRSIQLSYWGIYWNIVAENKTVVNRRDAADFAARSAYTVSSVQRGGATMKQCVDIDDLIFEAEDGGPSER